MNELNPTKQEREKARTRKEHIKQRVNYILPKEWQKSGKQLKLV